MELGELWSYFAAWPRQDCAACAAAPTCCADVLRDGLAAAGRRQIDADVGAVLMRERGVGIDRQFRHHLLGGRQPVTRFEPAQLERLMDLLDELSSLSCYFCSAQSFFRLYSLTIAERRCRK